MVEKTICGNSELARLDLTLANAFESSVGRSAAAKKNRLTREQKEWLRQRNNCENSNNITACLVSAYRSRLAALAGE